MHDLTQTLMERIFSCLQPFRTSLPNCLFVCLMVAMTSSVRSQSERLVSRGSSPASPKPVRSGQRSRSGRGQTEERRGGVSLHTHLSARITFCAWFPWRRQREPECPEPLDPRSRFLILILIRLLRIQGDLVPIGILREGCRGQRSMAGNFLSHLSSSLVFPSNSTSSSILPLLLFLLLSSPARLSQSSDSCSSVCGAQISRLSITTTSVALAPLPEASLVCNLSIKPANYSRPESGGGAARPSEGAATARRSLTRKRQH